MDKLYLRTKFSTLELFVIKYKTSLQMKYLADDHEVYGYCADIYKGRNKRGRHDCGIESDLGSKHRKGTAYDFCNQDGTDHGSTNG